MEAIVCLNTQADRCHKDTKGYVKTTAHQVRTALVTQKGYALTDFCQSTVNTLLNRLGYTLKKVLKTQPLKRIEETDAIFENIALFRQRTRSGVLKLSLDVKDKVKVGNLSRRGYHRQKDAVKAAEKDHHWDHKLVPLGILEIDSALSTVLLGNSHETSDFIVDGLEKWYELRKNDLQAYHTLEVYLDNGPAVNSCRTQFINRMMAFACVTNLTIHLLYYPPYHSKYNPIERVWAAVENYWNGTLLTSVDKVVRTLENVAWKTVRLTAVLMDKVYQKGISLTGEQMQIREQFIHRNPDLPKWDVVIKPSFEMGMLFTV